MSKKQLDLLRNASGLFVGAMLLCYPAGFVLNSTIHSIPVLTSAALALGISQLLRQLGTLPSPLRIFVFFPIACSATFTLLVLPHPFMVIWLLIPFALLLSAQRNRFKSLPSPVFSLIILLLLIPGSLSLYSLLASVAHRGLPLLPSHKYLWMGILLVIPLGFATRKRLLPFAKAMLRYELLLFSILLGGYTLLWTAATAFKLPGEPALAFHDFKPLPRFFLLPKLGTDEIYPSELRNEPQRTDLLRTLDEMTWRLSDLYLQSTFSEDGEISPAEKVRAMKLYGFLQEDRHGPFLPGDSFLKPAPPEMDESYLEDFRQSMDQVVLSPGELSEILGIPLPKADDIFATLVRLNWVRQLKRNESHYRLTSQARHPFKNNLRPRQLLLLENSMDDERVEIDLGAYGKRRGLNLREKRGELTLLVENQAAENQSVWRLNQHVDFLKDPQLWRSSVPLILGLLLALLTGRYLPDELSKSWLWILCLIGIALFYPLPFTDGVLVSLRIGVGIWILRNLLPLNSQQCNRLMLFAAVVFIVNCLMTSLPLGTPLVHQALWVMIWTLPATVLLGVSLRKNGSAPSRENRMRWRGL